MAIIGIVLGVIALIISLAVLEGFERELTANAVRFSSHIRILSFNDKPISRWKEVQLSLLKSIPDIAKVIPTIETSSIIKTKIATEGVLLKSFYSDDLTNFGTIFRFNVNKFSSSEANEIFLGSMLAKKLAVGIGDSVIIIASVRNGENILASAQYFKLKVAGVFESGMGKYDETIAIVPFEFARRNFTSEGDAVTAFEVYINDITKVKSIANIIEELLGYPFYCFTFYELHSSIFAWIELQREPIPLVLSLMTLVASLNVVTFLLINILENTKSIGILVTLGMQSKQIILLFLQYGLIIALIGITIGCLISFGVCFLQDKFHIIQLDSKIYYLTNVPVSINIIHYLMVIGFSILVVFLASLFPSVIASRLDPARALRFSK
ncbi:MAG: ABC transporter permease [Candidatus Kapaibacteriales bacterium]